MELIAYIHSALAHEQSLQGIELEPPLDCVLLNSAAHSIKSAKLLMGVSLATATLVSSLNIISFNAQPAAAAVPEISILQTLLADRGFDPGPIDGVKGESTTDAIVRAQSFYGLEPDGVVGQQTLAALNNDTPPTTSSDSSDLIAANLSVKELQKLLSDRGFYTGAIDGVLGSRTKSAIVSAQKYYGLTTDGIAGSATLAALQNDTKSPSSKPTTASSSSTSQLQKLLSDRGFYTGAIDGILGAGTSSAIVSAQKYYGLTPDGIAGSATLAALQNDSGSNPTKPASSSDTVQLQKLLSDRGFYSGAIDGISGSGTKSAVVAAQKYYGLTPDGIAGSSTLAALQSDNNGSSNQGSTSSSDVMRLQTLLTQKGFYNGPISGVLGPLTKDGIIAAQRAYGLVQDGIAGPSTLAALGSAPIISTPTPNPSPIVGSEEIARLQRLLAQRGFYTGSIDGFAGDSTRAAIVVAQRFYSLTPDGVAGPATINALQSGGTSTGTNANNPQVPSTIARNEILNIQNLLTDRKFYTGPIDGVLGNGTKSAIIAAQRYYGLVADGVPGPATVAALEANSSQVNPNPTNNPSTPVTGTVSTKEVQRLLALRGFYTGSADGSLSNETKNAVIRAQNFYGISPADGNPSSALVNSLNSDPFVANNAPAR